ncbi:hypothetical protein [Paenibacillus anseongense]|uniref:hypothetical protein n=1 Tax=Paenibacillus anseongense TaxID=2682845 RepID=UPI002DBCEDAF|nr:hypothetical protein [Paenibacillus anseongense]MEC0265150.1 hypothetical protein [Paenibacillus anseongense]
MSITQKDTSEYVAKYYFDRYGLKISGDEVLAKYPWHEIVWEKFFAYAYYKKPWSVINKNNTDLMVKIINKLK